MVQGLTDVEATDPSALGAARPIPRRLSPAFEQAASWRHTPLSLKPRSDRFGKRWWCSASAFLRDWPPIC